MERRILKKKKMVDCFDGFWKFWVCFWVFSEKYKIECKTPIASHIVLQMKDGRCYHCVRSMDLDTVTLEVGNRVTNERWKKLPLC